MRLSLIKESDEKVTSKYDFGLTKPTGINMVNNCVSVLNVHFGCVLPLDEMDSQNNSTSIMQSAWNLNVTFCNELLLS
jgi:hypothetical protein